jgi:hypothetical protein
MINFEQEHEKQQVVLCKSTLKMMSRTTDMNTPAATHSHYDFEFGSNRGTGWGLRI